MMGASQLNRIIEVLLRVYICFFWQPRFKLRRTKGFRLNDYKINDSASSNFATGIQFNKSLVYK